MISGPELFCRYAYPPNLLGYCGPDERETVGAIATGLDLASEETTRIAEAFHGAWPYLELIGQLAGRPPLDRQVVEAYWLGGELLDRIDLHHWGNSVEARFRPRAGNRWVSTVDAVNRGGGPNHAFHVFCVYPWVGLLREGFVGPSMEVLDRCRISWGTVTATDGPTALVRRRPLVWRDDSLVGGDPIVESFEVAPQIRLADGDVVSLHWRHVCEQLDRMRLRTLRRVHDLHLRLANDELRAARMEPASMSLDR